MLVESDSEVEAKALLSVLLATHENVSHFHLASFIASAFNLRSTTLRGMSYESLPDAAFNASNTIVRLFKSRNVSAAKVTAALAPYHQATARFNAKTGDSQQHRLTALLSKSCLEEI